MRCSGNASINRERRSRPSVRGTGMLYPCPALGCLPDGCHVLIVCTCLALASAALTCPEAREICLVILFTLMWPLINRVRPLKTTSGLHCLFMRILKASSERCGYCSDQGLKSAAAPSKMTFDPAVFFSVFGTCHHCLCDWVRARRAQISGLRSSRRDSAHAVCWVRLHPRYFLHPLHFGAAMLMWVKVMWLFIVEYLPFLPWLMSEIPHPYCLWPLSDPGYTPPPPRVYNCFN